MKHLLDRDYSPIQDNDTDWFDVALVVVALAVPVAILALYFFTLTV